MGVSGVAKDFQVSFCALGRFFKFNELSGGFGSLRETSGCVKQILYGFIGIPVGFTPFLEVSGGFRRGQKKNQ